MIPLECVTRAGLLPANADAPTNTQSAKSLSRAGLIPAYADSPTESKSPSRAALLPAFADPPTDLQSSNFKASKSCSRAALHPAYADPLSDSGPGHPHPQRRQNEGRQRVQGLRPLVRLTSSFASTLL